MRHYAEAIDALCSDLDWKRVVREFAKTNPASFVRAAKCSGWMASMDLAAHVRELLRADKYVNAIKLVRSERGLSLKEAKDFVDALK